MEEHFIKTGEELINDSKLLFPCKDSPSETPVIRKIN